MQVYSLGDRVKIRDIPDPPFPGKIGRVGEITFIHPPGQEQLYDVTIDGQRYACYASEIEPAD